MFAATPGAAHNPFDGRRDHSAADMARQEVDTLRRNAFIVSMVYIALAVAHLFSFWVGYIWTLLVLGLVAFTGMVGVKHFSSMDNLQYDSCIFAPLNAVNNFGNLSIIIIVGGALGFLTFVGLAYWYNEQGLGTFLAFAIIGIITMVGYVAAGFFGLHFGKKLHTACRAMESMRPPEWVAAPPSGHVNAANGHVVQGVPIASANGTGDSHGQQQSSQQQSAAYGNQHAVVGYQQQPPQQQGQGFGGGGYVGSQSQQNQQQ